MAKVNVGMLEMKNRQIFTNPNSAILLSNSH